MFQIDLEQCLKNMINILIYLSYKISNQDKANINTWKNKSIPLELTEALKLSE